MRKSKRRERVNRVDRSFANQINVRMTLRRFTPGSLREIPGEKTAKKRCVTQMTAKTTRGTKKKGTQSDSTREEVTLTTIVMQRQ